MRIATLISERENRNENPFRVSVIEKVVKHSIPYFVSTFAVLKVITKSSFTYGLSMNCHWKKMVTMKLFHCNSVLIVAIKTIFTYRHINIWNKNGALAGLCLSSGKSGSSMSTSYALICFLID